MKSPLKSPAKQQNIENPPNIKTIYSANFTTGHSEFAVLRRDQHLIAVIKNPPTYHFWTILQTKKKELCQQLTSVKLGKHITIQDAHQELNEMTVDQDPLRQAFLFFILNTRGTLLENLKRTNLRNVTFKKGWGEDEWATKVERLKERQRYEIDPNAVVIR